MDQSWGSESPRSHVSSTWAAVVLLSFHVFGQSSFQSTGASVCDFYFSFLFF